MVKVYVALGSNLERHDSLQRAYRALKENFSKLQVSPVYKNSAVGFDGPEFYNCVTGFETEETHAQVLNTIRAIQLDIDKRWGKHSFNSRKIDLDLLIYGDLVANEMGKALPHADITTYAFVLKPLVDIAADEHHPLLQKTFQSLWDEFPQFDHPLTEINFTWE